MNEKDRFVGRRQPLDLRAAAAVFITVALAAVFAFMSGGYILARSAPAAIVYLLVAALWLWFVRDASRPGLVYLIALAFFGLFVAWAGLSVLWSIGPDLSWEAFDLAALYLVVAAVLGFTRVRRPELHLAAWCYLTTAVAVSLYAYAGKVLPDIVTHTPYARLSSPVGYWNVLALMMVLALPISLALAGDRTRALGWRVVAAAAAVPVTFTFFFTFSRGGWLALVIVLVAYFALAPARIAGLASLAAIAAPAAFVLWQLRGLDTLFDKTTNAALRAAEGETLLIWSIAALGATAAAQALVALAHTRVQWPGGVRMASGAIIIVVLGVVFVGGSWRYADARGGADWVRDSLHSFVTDTDAQSSANNAARLTSLNTYRVPLWREAMQQAQIMPLTGSGAGTFPFTHYRFRENTGVIRHAHSQWFNVLSELGIIGLVLFVPALVLFAVAAIGNPFSYKSDPSRAVLAALQAGALAFLVHISFDWDWDMAAIGVAFFVFVAMCAAYLATRRRDEGEPPHDAEAEDARRGTGRRDGRARRAALSLSLSLALVLLAASWAFPYFAARAEDDAFTASAEGDAAAALDHTRRAARLNPLAVDPLITQAQVLQQLGRNREALTVLQAAARLQPDNYDVYEQQGALYLKAFNRRKESMEAFARALSLNPADRGLKAELESAEDD